MRDSFPASRDHNARGKDEEDIEEDYCWNGEGGNRLTSQQCPGIANIAAREKDQLELSDVSKGRVPQRILQGHIAFHARKKKNTYVNVSRRANWKRCERIRPTPQQKKMNFRLGGKSSVSENIKHPNTSLLSISGRLPNVDAPGSLA